MSIALDYIFKPESIAVIGASATKGKIGHDIVHNLVTAEFNGKVFPINPKADVIHSIKAYPSVLDVADDIDMAIIVVPKKFVPGVIDECIKKEVKGLVIISAGFKETGGTGVEIERQLTEKIRKAGMRMVGPNCMGVINTDDNVTMNASFSKTYPKQGKTAFISQSGALGEAILDYSIETGIGLSKFISLGNRADVTANDMLEYLKNDSNVELVLLYLESFGNPLNFSRIARELSRKKPIIAVKSGRTKAGAKAASSHTGSLAGMDIAVDALFDQCGVLRVSTIEEMFDMAKVFVDQPRPRTSRVAILTNGGGPGILATDALVGRGLEMAEFSEKTLKELKSFLSEDAAVGNPVDMTGSSMPDDFGKALDVILKDPGVETAIVIVVMPSFLDAREVARQVISSRQKYMNKLVLTCFMTGTEDDTGVLKMLREANLPIFTYPESAAIALAGLEKQRNWLERNEGEIVHFQVEKSKVKSIIKKARLEKRQLLTIEESQEILKAYGIEVVPSLKIEDEDSAVAFVKKNGYPVVLKIVSSTISHKSDSGGVVLDIDNENTLRQEFKNIRQRFNSREVEAILIQKMVKGEAEVVIGMNFDPTFGPLIMFGLGGIYVEILKDVAFKMYPITNIDAEDMIKSIKGYKLLEGYRGKKPVDVQVLKEILLRISQLAGDFSEIQSLEINPFMAAGIGDKSCAVDARVILK